MFSVIFGLWIFSSHFFCLRKLFHPGEGLAGSYAFIANRYSHLSGVLHVDPGTLVLSLVCSVIFKFTNNVKLILKHNLFTLHSIILGSALPNYSCFRKEQTEILCFVYFLNNIPITKSWVYCLSSRVSERPDTRMSIDNLAKVFGPTMVGYSVANPDPMQMIAETKQQQDVMTSLLDLSSDYWTDVLTNRSDVDSLEILSIHTPDHPSRHPGLWGYYY